MVLPSIRPQKSHNARRPDGIEAVLLGWSTPRNKCSSTPAPPCRFRYAFGKEVQAEHQREDRHGKVYRNERQWHGNYIKYGRRRVLPDHPPMQGHDLDAGMA